MVLQSPRQKTLHRVRSDLPARPVEVVVTSVCGPRQLDEYMPDVCMCQRTVEHATVLHGHELVARAVEQQCWWRVWLHVCDWRRRGECATRVLRIVANEIREHLPAVQHPLPRRMIPAPLQVGRPVERNRSAHAGILCRVRGEEGEVRTSGATE